MKKLSIFLVFVLTGEVLFAQKNQNLMQISKTYNPTSWGNNHLPDDSGLSLSDTFGGISFTGRYASYTNADTWYIIYATDGTMYSSFTDGSVSGQDTHSPNPWCGKIVGNDPLSLMVSVVGERVNHNRNEKIANRYGRYPSAQLMYNDIWYYGTYLLEENDRSLFVANHDWPILQPFVGFRVSENFGQTWYDQTTPDDPLLENFHDKWINAHGVEFNPYEVMIGAPHFVDFGQNMQYAPLDAATGRKWAYMVAHGADAGSELAHASWISGDNIYLLRILMPEGRNVEENSRYMNTASNWQYLAKDGTYKSWNRENLQDVYANICPIVDATGYMGNVGLTYNAPLGKFIMTLSRMNERDSFDTMILESDEIDGQYKVVQYMKGYATVSYFLNIPSRFISEDGWTMWLCYSSNYHYMNEPLSTIGGSIYALCLTEITLDGKNQAAGSKYEAEGMKRLGHSTLKIDTEQSNGAGVQDISRMGDGVEFYSKSKGNALALSTLNKSYATKSISVYVNDQFSERILSIPSEDPEEGEYALQYVPLNINYGDKVTLRISQDDIAYNRLYGEMRPDGSFVPNGEHHFFGDIDYALVSQVDFVNPKMTVSGRKKTWAFTLNCKEEEEHAMILRYAAAWSKDKPNERHLLLTVNKEKPRPLTLTFTNTNEDFVSVLTEVMLKKGLNTIKITAPVETPDEEVMVGSIGFTACTPKIVTSKIELQADGSIDACEMRLHGTAKVMNVHPGFTGRGFVAGLDVLGQKASVSFIPNVESGDYELSIVYSAGSLLGTVLSDHRELTLWVGEESSVEKFPLTETWQQWSEKKIRIHYSEGDKIKLSAERLDDNDDCINIDKFMLTKK